VAREWEVLIGDGPSIICEGRVNDINSLIGNLQGKKFQEAKQKLKEFVENYESRIFTFHIQKVKGYKSASYRIVSH
jgi:ribosomal protein L22